MFETQERLSLATEISVKEDILLDNLQPIERFLISLKAPETKRQYPKRLESIIVSVKEMHSLYEEYHNQLANVSKYLREKYGK